MKLEEKGFRVVHSNGDADLLIVQTALQIALNKDTVVVGDDTDLLVLLCYHANLESLRIFFRREQKFGISTT